MAIFKRKKDRQDYDYEDETDEEFKEKSPNTRKFKDLKPENRKKRKEPPKPWGRRERLIVFYVFLVTVIVSAGLGASARAWKLPGLPRLSFPSFNLFKEETVVIGNKANKEDEAKAKKIKDSFRESTKEVSGVYAFYLIDLGKNFSFGVNEKESMQAASLIKLPTLAALYKEAEDGNIDLETKYSLKNTDKIGGSGSLSGKAAGTILTYRDLARLMGKESDNTAWGIIKRVLGDEKINQVTTEMGMKDTNLSENKTTPIDIGLFFQKLWEGNFISKDSRDEILDYLTDTIYEGWMVAGVPADIRVAHKYGRETRTVNDAGIVFSKYPFILVLMSDGVILKEADGLFPGLAKGIFEEYVRGR